ncbi:hypothetical protein A1O7_05469 [Cladophialophora yegresii CBS 114405]|uniref:Mitochondrial adapter protein MCP1 transmembrane domain-containing protein n=1 Tax=Cladophialophora yegresii CBS 114405 TaxID=1182544 RepID=W9W0L6_9EURO|nr:uncharacterized protein A1O7_05469 [Cladophialophora yegresii CBS 114405]EXJ58046.1 hypothetical protein A1O7_05469 [Cladophialophora yegresii CBS 114405]
MADLPPLTTTDTRASLASMHEIDPSPVDDEEDPSMDTSSPYPTTDPTDPSSSTKDSSSSHAASPSQGTTNLLGLTPTRTLHLLTALQKYSVAPLGLYLAMHYTNTALIPLVTPSVRAADKYLLLTRPFYQTPPLEPLLIFLPVLTHVVSGVALRVYRRRITALRHGAETRSQRRGIAWPKLSATSAAGYALYPMFALHVLSMRVTPRRVDGSSASVGLRYFAHGIAAHPGLGLAAHALLIVTASYHFVSGAARFLRLSTEYVVGGGEDGRVKRKWRGRVINGVAALMAGVWIVGGLGVVGRSGPGVGWEASHWNAIYKEVPLVGRLF